MRCISTLLRQFSYHNHKISVTLKTLNFLSESNHFRLILRDLKAHKLLELQIYTGYWCQRIIRNYSEKEENTNQDKQNAG